MGSGRFFVTGGFLPRYAVDTEAILVHLGSVISYLTNGINAHEQG